MIMNIVHSFYLFQKDFFKIIMNNRCDLEQKVQLFDEIFPERNFSSCHIILDNIVQPKVSWVFQQLLIV